MLGQLLGEIATAVIALSIAKPLLPRLEHARVLADALRFSSALVPAAIASFLIEASDRIIIHGDLGAGAVGRYAVARNIGSFAMVLLQLVSFVWMPRLFAMKSESARRNVLATSRDALYVLVVTFAIMIAAASPLLLRLWAPPSYQPHTLLLITALIAAGALPVADSLIYQQVLILHGRTRVVATAAVAMALLNLGLNLLLVPVLGIDGSAAIACACYALGALRWRWLAGKAGPPTNWRPLLLALAGVAVCIASSAVPTDGIALVLRSLVALLAAGGFVAQLGMLVRPGWKHDLCEQLIRRSLRIQFEWSSDSHRP
jgi:O-antigen/teichoic acid export membrane protein